MNGITIRHAVLQDAEQFLSIYEYYVKNTAISFEYEAPSLTEFQKRMEKILGQFPYLAAEQNGQVMGYAYAGPFHERAAYQWSAELTVYLSPNARRLGLGRKLYETMESCLREMGILNLYACIGYPEEEDEYLTYDSAEFHKHMGFEQIGRFHKCGYKFNRWYDMIWMEKWIGKHQEEQPKIREASCLETGKEG